MGLNRQNHILLNYMSCLILVVQSVVVTTRRQRTSIKAFSRTKQDENTKIHCGEFGRHGTTDFFGIALANQHSNQNVEFV